jgi:carboxyl-terminal processing protease
MFKTLLVGVFVLCGAVVSFGQSGARDPFQIERGSSFEASTPRRQRVRVRLDAIKQDFSDALEIIRQNHVSGNKFRTSSLVKIATGEMLHALDPHSSYYDEREYREMQAEQHSEYSGIGAVIANYSLNGRLDTYIAATHPHSPALRAKLRFGDKIIRVNGVNVRDLPLSKVRNLIRGEQGTTARLVIERAADLTTETIVLKRELVAQPSIADAYVLPNGVGYIDLSGGFNFTTAQELNVALRDLQRLGAQSLILDLRENPGGLVEQAVRVAEAFLPRGKVILTQRGRGFDKRIWQSNATNPVALPLAVLVNGNTASASEIVAGALQDHNRAVIIGETTFGKGLVQSVFSLTDGAGLALTTAHYFTPAGRSLQRDYTEASGYYDYFARHRQNEYYAQIADKGGASKNRMSGGIVPDETVEAREFDKTEIKILNNLFFFARELANGRIENFGHYQIAGQMQFGQRIKPNELQVTPELINAFQNFGETKLNVKMKLKNREKFVVVQLRTLLATANFGAVTANQVTVENDVQVLRAVNALTRAKNLAQFKAK